MAVEVLRRVKHDGVVYEIGAMIHNLSDEIKAELIKIGVVKDLETDAAKVEEQVKEDAHTVGEQIQEDEDLVRGQVDEQLQNNVQQDIADATATAAAPGEPVAESGRQPSAEEIAATAADVQ